MASDGKLTRHDHCALELGIFKFHNRCVNDDCFSRGEDSIAPPGSLNTLLSFEFFLHRQKRP